MQERAREYRCHLESYSGCSRECSRSCNETNLKSSKSFNEENRNASRPQRRLTTRIPPLLKAFEVAALVEVLLACKVPNDVESNRSRIYCTQ
eukprot:COSAG02_NODE_3559_length_6563_cov_4.152382_6_plen_92_part_00